jgi:hypothetical protein
MKTIGIICIAFVALVALTGVAMAAVLPNATPETQGISTSTVVQCSGIVLSSENYASELSNQQLNGAPLAAAEVYGQSTYSGSLMAVKGVTTFVKTVDLNDKNQVLGGTNVKTNQVLDFAGYNGGQAVGDESATIFNAGQATSGKEQFLCPFTSAATTTVPPFNEAVIMTSHFDVTDIQENSQVGILGVAATGDVPSTINYNIGATGTGSIGTTMGVFAQDARGTGQALITPAKTVTTPAVKDCRGKVIVPAKTTTTPAVYGPVTPSSQIQYSEKTTAMGQFTFGKTMSYTSQVTA